MQTAKSNPTERRLAQLQRITPQQLRAFEACAALGSVTQAAGALHVTQPTVSVQLRELRETVGEALFSTQAKRMSLTPAGQALLLASQDLRACWERFDASLAELHGLVRGQLRVAAVTTAEYFVPDLLGPFAAAHPGVQINLAIENRDGVVKRLERGDDDVAVMMMPPAHLPLERMPFLENPLVVIAAHSHSLREAVSKRRLPLKRLASERWLMREAGSGTRIATEAAFAKQSFTPQVAMSLGSNEAIKHAVAAGLGVAVLSRLALGDAPPGKFAELPIQGFPIERQWFVVWRRDRPLTPAARGFVAHLRK